MHTPNYRTIKLLKELTWERNQKRHIVGSPIEIPHRYSDKRDIEISAFLTAWIYDGSSKSLLAAKEIDNLMEGQPFRWITQKRYLFLSDSHNQRKTLPHPYSYRDFMMICMKISDLLYVFGSIERGISSTLSGSYLESMQLLFNRSKGLTWNIVLPIIKLNMFLMWTGRNDGNVCLGLYDLDQSKLLIPLEREVLKAAKRLHLTNSRIADLKTSIEVTEALRWFDSKDPTKYYFGLLGYSEMKKSNDGSLRDIIGKPITRHRRSKNYYKQ